MSNTTKLADGIGIFNLDAIDLNKPAYSFTGLELKQLVQHSLAEGLPTLLLTFLPKDRPEKKRFVTKKEACVQLGSINLVTLDRLISLGKLTSYRPSPDRVVLDSEEIECYILSTKKAA